MIDILCFCGHGQRWHTINRCMRCDDDKCIHRFQKKVVRKIK